MNSALVTYCLKGLDKLWLSQYGRWSHIYHLDGRKNPNESNPHIDVFYTINVLLGLSRVRQVPSTLDLCRIFWHNVVDLPALPVAKYAFGCALWTAAELQLSIPNEVRDHINSFIFNKRNWLSFRAQDLGMILTGVVAQAQCNPQMRILADQLFVFLLERFRCPSGMFFDAASGVRRRFASFASQTYLTLACYTYGEFANDHRAIGIANSCVDNLIRLQGPNGEWPWFFDVPTATVLDYYEIYCVHQYGMAPAFLERAEYHGVLGAREALIKGFEWVFGQNQMGVSMLVPELHLTIRSQARRGELSSANWRALRAVRNWALGLQPSLVDPLTLELRRECRSYELGWILWSFGRRTDVPQITEHKMFM